MFAEIIDECLNFWHGKPCMEIYGKARREKAWRLIRLFATQHHDLGSRLPFFAGTCVTWTAESILVGWDFANCLFAEQCRFPCSRSKPVEVKGGRLRDSPRRRLASAPYPPSASEILAHECGHTFQALRLGPSYLPIVGSTTLFREGPNSYNRFENEASEQGMFGCHVKGSVCRELCREERINHCVAL